MSLNNPVEYGKHRNVYFQLFFDLTANSERHQLTAKDPSLNKGAFKTNATPLKNGCMLAVLLSEAWPQKLQFLKLPGIYAYHLDWISWKMLVYFTQRDFSNLVVHITDFLKFQVLLWSIFSSTKFIDKYLLSVCYKHWGYKGEKHKSNP